MRKLKLQVQMSVDGFIAGPNGEMDWMVWDWDGEINGIKPQGKPWTLFPTPRAGELNHIFSSAEAEREGRLKQFVADLTEPVDCIVLGRKLAEGFIPYRANVAANPNDPEFKAGKKFSDTNKVVFTKTLFSC